MNPDDVTWTRSSFCAHGDCLEAFRAGEIVLVRDSKVPVQVQAWSQREWKELLAAVRAGNPHESVQEVGLLGRVLFGLHRHLDDGGLVFNAGDWWAFRKGVEAGEFDWDRLASWSEQASLPSEGSAGDGAAVLRGGAAPIEATGMDGDRAVLSVPVAAQGPPPDAVPGNRPAPASPDREGTPSAHGSGWRPSRATEAGGQGPADSRPASVAAQTSAAATAGEVPLVCPPVRPVDSAGDASPRAGGGDRPATVPVAGPNVGFVDVPAGRSTPGFDASPGEPRAVATPGRPGPTVLERAYRVVKGQVPSLTRVAAAALVEELHDAGLLVDEPAVSADELLARGAEPLVPVEPGGNPVGCGCGRCAS